MRVRVFLSYLLWFDGFYVWFFFMLCVFVFDFVCALGLVCRVDGRFFLLFRCVYGVFLRGFGRFFLVCGHFVKTTVCTPTVSPQTCPPCVHILVDAGHSARKPTAFFAFSRYQGRVLVALPFIAGVGYVVSTSWGLLYFFGYLVFCSSGFQPLRGRPFDLILISSLAYRGVASFLLTVSCFSNVCFVYWGATDYVLAPFTVSFYLVAFFV